MFYKECLGRSWCQEGLFNFKFPDLVSKPGGPLGSRWNSMGKEFSASIWERCQLGIMRHLYWFSDNSVIESQDWLCGSSCWLHVTPEWPFSSVCGHDMRSAVAWQTRLTGEYCTYILGFWDWSLIRKDCVGDVPFPDVCGVSCLIDSKSLAVVYEKLKIHNPDTFQ